MLTVKQLRNKLGVGLKNDRQMHVLVISPLFSTFPDNLFYNLYT